MESEERYCMECVEGRPVALGLCADCLAGEPLQEVIRQIARLSRELEEARELLRELAGDDEAGLAWEGGWRCVYCDSRARYTVLHDAECPIVRARRALGEEQEVSDAESGHAGSWPDDHGSRASGNRPPGRRPASRPNAGGGD